MDRLHGGDLLDNNRERIHRATRGTNSVLAPPATPVPSRSGSSAPVCQGGTPRRRQCLTAGRGTRHGVAHLPRPPATPSRARRPSRSRTLTRSVLAGTTRHTSHVLDLAAAALRANSVAAVAGRAGGPTEDEPEVADSLVDRLEWSVVTLVRPLGLHRSGAIDLPAGGGRPRRPRPGLPGPDPGPADPLRRSPWWRH